MGLCRWARSSTTWQPCGSRRPAAPAFLTALLWQLLDIQQYIEHVQVYNLTVAFAAAFAVNIIVSLCSRPRAAP